MRDVVLRDRGAAERIARGHPWIWREAVANGFDGVSPGDEVQVLAPDRSAIGRGLADPGSPIAIRIWTHERRPLDPSLWRERAHRARRWRDVLFSDGATDAFRVVHGEGDRMPGFVLDRYGPAAVLRCDGAAAEARVEDAADALWPEVQTWGVRSLVLRVARKGEAPRLDPLRGDPPPAEVRVREHGVPFVVDLARGQKTGAFLDQRDNRRRVGELASARRVLNLFSYAGGFSLHAALGGATHVTSVDVAAAAHATAQASFRLAGVDPSAHAFVTADVRAFLDAARGRQETWDLIVSDPPSYAPNERALPKALAAYRALHRACANVLAPGGIFCAASCSSHVDAVAFLGTLDDATLVDRGLVVAEVRGAGADHPCPASFPEGRYLKFTVLA